MARDIANSTGVKNMLGAYATNYNGHAILDEGVTVTDDRWFPLATGQGTTAVNSGTGQTLFAWMHGLVILPPKALFGMVSTATSTSNTTRKGAIWAEVPRSWLVPA